MNELQTELYNSEPMETDDAPDTSATTPIQWLLRSYETSREWKDKAKDVFFSVNGDSDLARNRVAGIVRNYFIENKNRLEPEDVGRWKDGENVAEKVRVVPPTVTESNSTYVDWVYIADFLLLPFVSLQEALDAENQRRETEFDNAMRSYKKRLAVEDAREAVRSGSLPSDAAILESLKIHHPDASLATIKVARKLEKENAIEPKAREPKKSAPMPPFKALYFPCVK